MKLETVEKGEPEAKFSTDTVARRQCLAVMEEAGFGSAVVNTFARLYDQLARGITGEIGEEEIESPTGVTSYEDLLDDGRLLEVGRETLAHLAVCKLNGGLGTGMGLSGPKSTLVVKGSKTFNDINQGQVQRLREGHGVDVPLLNMTSFSTDGEVKAFFGRYPHKVEGFPTTFMQHKHPKIYADSLMPAREVDEELNWNPPGHGDIYSALKVSGLLDQMLRAGKRYLFVSNADNTGATPDPLVLGYLADNKIPFLMEVAERTAADSKGGHLARRLADSRLILRESAQAPKDQRGEPIAAFQDVSRYKYFNTNSIWIDLEALDGVLQRFDNAMPLPLIRNEKTVNPRDSKSRKVYQIETAMGAAIEVFEGARAIMVPRGRFIPVKANSDLLVVRSDAYEIGDDGSLQISANRHSSHAPLVSLDGNFYKMLSDFEDRLKQIPSLVDAEKFEIRGNVVINHALKIVGVGKILDQRDESERKVGPVVMDSSVTTLNNQQYVVTSSGWSVEKI